MASSIASQLQAIKSLVQADSTALERPFTRPSIIYSPKVAADIDIETIYGAAIQGLEALVSADERFRNYKNDLFSSRSRELDRELMGREDNDRINASISAYLRLLSGHLQLRASLDTLEYLIRRYKIHVYNMEDLILCALPYHETHTFVLMVQLLNTRNSKWKFLDGVKTSGAPPPRSVIVQQCIRDMGVLDCLCEYASRTKKNQPSRPVISFCTAVVVEVLGSLQTLDTDTLKRILPFVDSGLQPGIKEGSDQQAGALMIVGLLANKSALNPNLVKRFIRSIVEIAFEHSKESSDPQWLRLSFVALINFVQRQSVELISKKALDVLKEIRNIAGVLVGLSEEFNIERFLTVLLDSLIHHSSDDDLCLLALTSIIETVPMRSVVNHLVLEVFSMCMAACKKSSDLTSTACGNWAKKILAAVDKTYPTELRITVRKFLEDPSVQSKKEGATLEKLCNLLDENFDMSLPFSDSKIWFQLHHPKAEVRRATLSSLNASGIINGDPADTQRLMKIQDIVLRQLRDDDLTVVLAALSLDGLVELMTASDMIETLSLVVKKSFGIFSIGSSENIDLAVDVVSSFLKIAVSSSHQKEYMNKVAAIMFSCLLLQPKVWKLKVHVLELVKEVNWPLFEKLVPLSGLQTEANKQLLSGSLSPVRKEFVTILAEAVSLPPDEHRLELLESFCNFKLSELAEVNLKLTEEERNKLQKELLKRESISSYDMEIVNSLAETFVKHPCDYLPWLIESCCDFTSSKSLFLLILMQSFHLVKNDCGQFLALYKVCFPVLKVEWEVLDTTIDVPLKQLLKSKCRELLYELLDTEISTMNAKILVCLFWSFIETFISLAPLNVTSVEKGRLVAGLQELFVFFSSSRSRDVFKEHLHCLVRETLVSPVRFLSSFFTEKDVPLVVQLESLQCFLYLCSEEDKKWMVELLAEFPSLLVPLSSDNQELRTAAMNCIEGLYDLWRRVDFSSKKNGNAAVWSNFLDELLGLMAQQRRLIISDKMFLPSFLSSLLGSSNNDDLLAPRNMQERFDQSTKEKIIAFILGSALRLAEYGKLVEMCCINLISGKDLYTALFLFQQLRILSLLKGLGTIIVRVKDVDSLFSQLLEQRTQYYSKLDKSCQKLSETEIQILCLLLECSMTHCQSFDIHFLEGRLLKTLKMDCILTEDPAVISPCLTVLKKLSNQVYGKLRTEVQDSVLCELVPLIRTRNGDMQNMAKEALMRLKISCSAIVGALNPIIQHENLLIGSFGKKKRKSVAQLEDNQKSRGEKALHFLSSLLDLLLLKKDLTYRESLIGPLFKLLERSMSHEWVHGAASDKLLLEDSSGFPQTISNSICSIQQSLLLILRDIFDSLNVNALKSDMVNEVDLRMLVEYADSSKDGVTCNYVFSLFSSIAKVVPQKILDHINDILALVAESTVTQVDSHSQHVFEDFISAIVPFWLSKSNNSVKLLEIFLKVLANVSERRRLSIGVHLLKTLGVQDSLASLLVLLFRSLVSRRGLSLLDAAHTSESFSSLALREWEYAFAVQICEQYSCMIWLPSLVTLLQLIRKSSPSQELVLEMRVVTEFILQKLQDPEFAFKLGSKDDASDAIQRKLAELMEGIISLSQAIDATPKQKGIPSDVKKETKAHIRVLLITVTTAMIPSAFFNCIINLLQQTDNNLIKKALGLLSETAKDTESHKQKNKGKRFINPGGRDTWSDFDKISLESFGRMCEEIVYLIDEKSEEASNSPKLTAISTLEVLATRFLSGHQTFIKCLTSVVKGISSKNLAVSSGCLCTCSALINVLGPKALAELPCIMKNLIAKSQKISLHLPLVSGNDNTAAMEESLMLSILATLESVIKELGGFLNPYLGDIMELMVLRPEFVSESYQKFKTKADDVRRLLSEKVPVRLTLQPLLKIYNKATNAGDFSLAVAFEMLADLVGKMDKSSVSAYHGKIFDQCLLALDLRRQNPASVQNINIAERSIIDAMVALTMKLTESMFKPLFIKSVEWAESEVEDESGGESKSIDRAISFFGLVNKLSKTHRLVFVPYFKYLVDSCVSHLDSAGDAKTLTSTRKKKKAKIQDGDTTISLKIWHLRSLVLSSLHTCFVYDTGSLKFLDTNNFQVLLKPVVSQLIIDPPTSLENQPDIPSVQEVDDLLVECVGQMAVAAGSDLLWKPLNHEVLMQTRSEKIRARIVGLRIVKQFLENLKEEYLVLLAETIPFLGELLEDVELPVKSLAQDVLKQMEEMSGENLREYL